MSTSRIITCSRSWSDRAAPALVAVLLALADTRIAIALYVLIPLAFIRASRLEKQTLEAPE